MGGNTMKNILLAASECVPFIKTGGLADVIGALPKYIDKTEYDVRVILPKYTCIDQAMLCDLRKVASCAVTLNWRHQYVALWETKLEDITYYFIENDFYYSVETPYGEIHKDAEAFAFFSKAVLTVLPLAGFCPDVIHCNDWQTGWIPVFLKEQFKGNFYKNIKTIFTIHNMRFQGRWNLDAYKDITGLPDRCFAYDKLEHFGDASPFKGGVVYSDAVTTVSKTYALEIQTEDYGEGLSELMQYRSPVMTGIVNGLDTVLHDPAADPLILHNYDVDTFGEYKVLNKIALQEELDLTADPAVFLIGMVSRITDQKGFDLVLEKLDTLMEYEDIQIALQGTGDPVYQDQLRRIAARYPGRIAVRIQYSEQLAHRIYASADAFLMPSHFEPCGLSQLISLRYGTIPMVRATGGLKDTVLPFDAKAKTGNGFRFQEYDADAMLETILTAYELYKTDEKQWNGLIRRAMAQDYSWDRSAAEYEALYQLERDTAVLSGEEVSVV